MNLVSSMVVTQYMHFIVMRTFFVKRGKASVDISAYAYLFSEHEVLPGGQYTATSVGLPAQTTPGDAAKACAKLFRDLRDKTSSPVSNLKLVDHTEGKIIAKYVNEADQEELAQLKAKEAQ